MAPRRTTRTLGQRRSLARQIELVLDPRSAARRGYARTPCIPIANRAVVYRPLRRAIEMLCDETLILVDTSLDRLAELSLNPRSALYQPYQNRARFLTHEAVDRLGDEARSRSDPPCNDE